MDTKNLVEIVRQVKQALKCFPESFSPNEIDVETPINYVKGWLDSAGYSFPIAEVAALVFQVQQEGEASC